MKIREYAFFPAPSAPVSLGLLFCETPPEGRRGTAIVDAEWLRTLVAGHVAGVDLGGLEVPADSILPQVLPGWPDEWPEASPYPDILRGMTEQLESGDTWGDLHVSATRLAAESD